MSGSSVLVWGVLFGSVGMGFFIYGRRQRAVVPLVAGLALMVVPYFVPNVYLLLLVGCALIALPYFVRV
jgi:hypothetical protein